LLFLPIKIKIVGKSKTLSGARFSRAKRDIRPYNMRVSRDHGGGLWTIESDDGQLYLAVLSPLSDDIRRQREQHRASQGA